MTAGNSTPLTDGASAVLLGSDEWAAERSLPVLAHIVDWETAAVDYVHGDDGLLMAPVYAVPRLLKRNDLTFDDFDFIEIHEAFASQVLATLKAWEDDEVLPREARPRRRARDGRPRQAQPERVVARRGPSVRRDRRPDPGHAPRRCSTRRARGRSLISICAAGGQGVVAIVEK